ncbi:3-oxoadipate CoA-transferase subunit A [Achromobacter denitrificans]|jgi:3-oxoadipate CoA-transferase alpha subunit|uniref:3-oxoacid CoA-transferase subunit A n=1 Tax=Achromobacter denitrificans TaxID=32002 RepID=UPI000A4AC1F6|nr:3-oxoacid CoA-transferase subunit A [Achromobacter denitrificans]GFN24866.1 3-oxoadipate CoA-transferase subunit A [Achromobacter denitrificans]
MLDKTVDSLEAAVAGVRDGSVILIGGFGASGVPTDLICALLDQGARELTIVNNNAGNGERGLSQLVQAGRVRKMICSFARSSDRKNPNAAAFAQAYRAGKIELECVPQGTMAERMRAAGAGLGPFFTPTAYGTPLAEGKETRVVDGVGYVLETPLKGDFAFVKALRADRWGNLVYRYAGRNFAPVMCMAATTAVAQAGEIVSLGAIPPEHVMTPGIFVKRVVREGGQHGI